MRNGLVFTERRHPLAEDLVLAKCMGHFSKGKCHRDRPADRLSGREARLECSLQSFRDERDLRQSMSDMAMIGRLLTPRTHYRDNVDEQSRNVDV